MPRTLCRLAIARAAQHSMDSKRSRCPMHSRQAWLKSTAAPVQINRGAAPTWLQFALVRAECSPGGPGHTSCLVVRDLLLISSMKLSTRSPRFKTLGAIVALVIGIVVATGAAAIYAQLGGKTKKDARDATGAVPVVGVMPVMRADLS